MTMLRRSALDIVLLFGLATLWGASYTFIRVGVETIPPLTLMAARTAIAGLLLAAWNASAGIKIPRTKEWWGRFATQALLNSVVPFTLIAWAEQTVSAGLATILNSTSPLFTFAATAFTEHNQQPNHVKLAGLGLGFLGICLVVGPSALGDLGAQMLPQAAIVVATICYAGAALYGRSFGGMAASIPAACSLLVGAVVLTPVALVVDRPWLLRPSARSLAALVALSIFSTAIAFVIYFRLVKSIGSLKTTAQAYLRVPIGVAIAAVFLGETLAPSAWLGLFCVVAGVAALTLSIRSKNER